MSIIVDAHYHLEEEIETLESLLNQMQEYGVNRVVLIPKMNEPFQLKPIPKKASEYLPRLLMGSLRSLGLFLYNSTVTSDGKLSTLGIKYLLYHKPDNSYIDLILQKYPDKFLGWIFVNPKTMNPIDEIEKWAGRTGWIGVKTHPFWHNYPVRNLDDAAALCQEKEMPILIHLGGNGKTGDYRYLPDRFPKLKIIYAHAAVPYYREVWSYAKNKENVFIDLSSSVYLNDEILSAAINSIGFRKCLYGTDGPYAHATQSLMLDRIHRLNLSDVERDHILGANFLMMTGM